MLTTASPGNEDEVFPSGRPMSMETDNPVETKVKRFGSNEAMEQKEEPVGVELLLPTMSEQKPSYLSRSAGDSGSLLLQRRTVVAR